MMFTQTSISATGKPVYTPIEVPDVLFGELFFFRCDCGWTSTIHRLPVRCLDCGELWLNTEHIARTPGAELRRF